MDADLGVFRHLDHLQHRFAGGIHSDGNFIPQFLDVAQHQPCHIGAKAKLTADFSDDVGDPGRIDLIGLASGQLATSPILIFHAFSKFQDIHHEYRRVSMGA